MLILLGSVFLLTSLVVGLMLCADLQLTKETEPSCVSSKHSNSKVASNGNGGGGKISPEILTKKMSELKKQNKVASPAAKQSKTALKGVLVTQPLRVPSAKMNAVHGTKVALEKGVKGVMPPTTPMAGTKQASKHVVLSPDSLSSKIKSHHSGLVDVTNKSNSSIKQYETEKFEAGNSTIPDLVPKSQLAKAK